MSVVVLFSALFAAVPTAPAATTFPGKTVYEAAGYKACKTFNKPAPLPDEPVFEDRTPYRGENMLKPIGPLDEEGQPPTRGLRGMKLPDSLIRNGKAKAVVTVDSEGQVVRVEASSQTDARLAAFFAANVSLWQYPPRPPADNCRKVDVEVEVEAE